MVLIVSNSESSKHWTIIKSLDFAELIRSLGRMESSEENYGGGVDAKSRLVNINNFYVVGLWKKELDNEAKEAIGAFKTGIYPRV